MIVKLKSGFPVKLKSRAAPEKHGPKESENVTIKSFVCILRRFQTMQQSSLQSDKRPQKKWWVFLTDPLNQARGILESSRVLTVSRFSRSLRERLQFSSVQSLSRVRLFATPWIAHQASLSITNSREFTQTHVHPVGDAILSSVVPFSSCPQSLPASKSFPMSPLFAWGGQSTGVSALASFLPKKSQGWSPSEWTGWISLASNKNVFI